jgi:hypothetical protein
MPTLQYLFVCIEPFRRMMLSLLCLSEISAFLKATRCRLSTWEQERYIRLIDDIFKDSSTISQIVSAGLTVRILGSNIDKLRTRLRDLLTYTSNYLKQYYLFVLVSASPRDPNCRPTLVRDFREDTEHGFVPDDLDLTELHARFDSPIAEQIAEFSSWVLCAPYLAGTMLDRLPGWIPLLTTLPQVHVRTYMSTYNDCNGRILQMSRSLIKRLFSLEGEQNLLRDLSSLETYVLQYNRSRKTEARLRANLVFGFLYSLLDNPNGQGDRTFIITHALHSSSCCITVELQ